MGDRVASFPARDVLLFGANFWVIPIVLDGLFLRVFPRWKWLRWFRWNPPLGRAIPVSLLISTLAFGGGMAAVYAKNVGPAIVRAFPLRPKAYPWKAPNGYGQGPFFVFSNLPPERALTLC